MFPTQGASVYSSVPTQGASVYSPVPVQRASAYSPVPIQGASAYSSVPVQGIKPVTPSPQKYEFQTTSPKQPWMGESPSSQHKRRSNDFHDRWKKNLMHRSQSYNHTFIDSHCHIDFLYSRINSPVVSFKDFMESHSDSFPVNFEACVSVFCNPRTFINYRPDGNDILNVVSKDEKVYIAAGCHPKNATEFKDEHALGLLKILKECPKVVALGEIGLDYSGKFHQFSEVQKSVFRQQLHMAIRLNFPLVIHCRDADDDCLEILQEIVPRQHKIHAHCFTRDYRMANKWLTLFPNLYLGLTPLITYKTALDAKDTARSVPLDRLLLETDAPYFLPAGTYLELCDEKYSHPGMALYTAETVAWLKGIPVNEVLKACRENTRFVYGI